MRHSAVSFLILYISLFQGAFACGPYYPGGDDIRFSLMKPAVFPYAGFADFYYAAGEFYSSNYFREYIAINDSCRGWTKENTTLWRKRCRNIPGEQDIVKAIYGAADETNNPRTTNTFIRYLRNTSDTAALNYLAFARKCSPYNSVLDDPWEREEHARVPQRVRLADHALACARTSGDGELRARYAFLAIRLAWYNEDNKTVANLFREFFATRKKRDILYYWSLHFMNFTETDSIRRNFNAAQVFMHAPDKRSRVFYSYDKAIPVQKTLHFAHNNDEVTAVWMMSGFRNTGKTLEVMKKLYTLNPRLQGLSFLLLREVNKLEDWIYTPYYTRFGPSLIQWDEGDQVYPGARIREDRQYAQKLLEFVNAADPSVVENPLLWKVSKAYLLYMTGNYDASLGEINLIQKNLRKGAPAALQLEMIVSLCLLKQQKDTPVIPMQARSVLMREFAAANNKFVFAVARELEYGGNTTDAAILLSKLKARTDPQPDEAYWRNGVYWKTAINHYTLFVDYYDDYFFYLDAQYTPAQLHNLITDVESARATDAYSTWKYRVIRPDLPRLYDLLGTKYIRQNNLDAALLSFEKVKDTLWTSSFYPYKTYLDANPFYANMYSEHNRTPGDTVRFNKAGITRRLIGYLKKAGDPSVSDRPFFCFLAANCYLNMTQYGNSWMMRRYYWTAYLHPSKLEDDDEYYNCRLAKQYYLEAGELSKNRKFAALCLRMAARCEDYAASYAVRDIYPPPPTTANRFTRDLREHYAEYYGELVSNCESFESYFNARR